MSAEYMDSQIRLVWPSDISMRRLCVRRGVQDRSNNNLTESSGCDTLVYAVKLSPSNYLLKILEISR